MLTLVVTVLATAYFVVPELLSRFVLGFFFVRKTMRVPKSEELMRGAFWALVPLIVAWRCRNICGFTIPQQSRDSGKLIFSALYTDKIFSNDPQAFFKAVTIFTRANLCLLGRTYLVVIAGSLLLGILARNFGLVRSLVRPYPKVSKVLHRLVLPQISEWHIALSTMLLANPKQYAIGVDVLTDDGTLYRGSVEEKIIDADGKLQTLILGSPERFLRTDFVRDRSAYEGREMKEQEVKPVSQSYWRKIPGELFLLSGDSIKSVNVRHVDLKKITSVKADDDKELLNVLQQIKEALARETEGLKKNKAR